MALKFIIMMSEGDWLKGMHHHL